MTITTSEKYEFMREEFELCRRRCHHRVVNGRMTRKDAERKMALMAAIRQDYREKYYDDTLAEYERQANARSFNGSKLEAAVPAADQQWIRGHVGGRSPTTGNGDEP